MFQFRRFPSYTYLFSVWYTDVTLYGLLHSDIFGSKRACHSPKLFAAYRVLHRLLMPRHPPCALISLNSLRRIMSCSLHFKNFFLGEVSWNCNIPIFYLKHWISLISSLLFVIQFSKISLSPSRHLKSFGRYLVEIKGIEPLTPCLQSRCSPSWAKPPILVGTNGPEKLVSLYHRPHAYQAVRQRNFLSLTN